MLGAPVELVLSFLDAQPFATQANVVPDGIDVTCKVETPAARLPPVRITLPAGLARVMQSHAAKRLVPDTAASRAGGAGAGLTDND